MFDLFYPLGFLATAAFTLRFFIQWILSEREQRSVVPRSFWQISLLGNGLMVLHSIFQFQYHVGVIQAINAIISWRNLNLMSPQKKRVSRWVVILLFGIAFICLTTLFIVLNYWLFGGTESWFRSPTYFFEHNTSVSWVWHGMGILGMLSFSSRFWIQWWNSEKYGESVLNPLFWWLSLAGAFLSAIYFAFIYDAVNFLGAVGFIPYIRNLMLLRKSTKLVVRSKK